VTFWLLSKIKISYLCLNKFVKEIVNIYDTMCGFAGEWRDEKDANKNAKNM